MSGVEVVTFGCRLNAFESEVIAGDERLMPHLHLSLQTATI
jgi:tRNA A37 methylthiotransferase MiaB